MMVEKKEEEKKKLRPFLFAFLHVFTRLGKIISRLCSDGFFKINRILSHAIERLCILFLENSQFNSNYNNPCL
jgi:hypothetical protein